MVELCPRLFNCPRYPSSCTDHDRLYTADGLFLSSLSLFLVINHLLLSAGDVEQNPGPISKDAKPTLQNLQYMSFTCVDGRTVHFRLMDRIKPRVTQLAISLGFPQYIIDGLEIKQDPVYYILGEWLKGGNQEHDQKPLTWGTLITALQHAGLLEEAEILDKHFVTASPVAYLSTQPLTSCSVEHCSIEMLVKPCIVEDLRSLMRDYSMMLTLLKTAKMPKKKFDQFKVFLSTYCDDVSLRDCSRLDRIIEQLEFESIIYLFNIDTLVVCCMPSCQLSGKFLPFFESKVCRSVLEYKEHIKQFVGSKSIDEFHCSLRFIKEKHDNVEVTEVTLKLAEPKNEDTAKKLLKIPCQIFGITGKRFRLREVRPGCVCVTWSVPTSLVPILTTKAKQLSPEHLASKGIIELVIGLRIAPNEVSLSTHTASSVDVSAASDMNTSAGNPFRSEMSKDSMRKNETELLADSSQCDCDDPLLQEVDISHHTCSNPLEVLKEEGSNIISRSNTASAKKTVTARAATANSSQFETPSDLLMKLHFLKTSGKIRDFMYSDSDDNCYVVLVMNDREKTEVRFSSKGLGSQNEPQALKSALQQAVDFLSEEHITSREEYQQLSTAASMKGIAKDQCVNLLHSYIRKYYKDKPLPTYEARQVSEQVYEFTISHELFGTFKSNASKGKSNAKQNAARKAIMHLKQTQQWIK